MIQRVSVVTPFENADCLNTPFREEAVNDIIGRARSLGIEPDKKFDRIAKLQEVLADALSERACIEAAGENTVLHDELIDQLREAIEKEAEEMD
jgi:hypothetical protein